MPVVGVVEPGAAMAAEVSKTRAAIVIATEATVSSHAYRDALQRHGLAAYEKACPLFVPLVEEGWIEHPVTEQVATIYLGEALAQAPERADVLVLACTHYPLIAPLLRRIVPSHMQIVDSAESTARVVKKMIDRHPTLSPKAGDKGGAPAIVEGNDSKSRAVIESDENNNQGVILSEVRLPHAAAERSRRTPMDAKVFPAEHRTFRFYVTDSTDKFKRLATRFLGRQVDHVEHVDLGG